MTRDQIKAALTDNCGGTVFLDNDYWSLYGPEGNDEPVLSCDEPPDCELLYALLEMAGLKHENA